MKTNIFRHGKAALASAFAVGLIVASSPLAQSEEETTAGESPAAISNEQSTGELPAELLDNSPVTVGGTDTGEADSAATAAALASESAPAASPATADAQERSATVGPQADFKLETVKVDGDVATVKVSGTITDETGLNKPMESLMLHKRGNKAEVSEVVSATYDGEEAFGDVFDFQPKELKDTFGVSDEDAQFPQILRISLEPTQDGDAKESLVGKKFSVTYKVPAKDKDAQWVLLPTDASFLPDQGPAQALTVDGSTVSNAVGSPVFDRNSGLWILSQTGEVLKVKYDDQRKRYYQAETRDIPFGSRSCNGKSKKSVNVGETGLFEGLAVSPDQQTMYVNYSRSNGTLADKIKENGSGVSIYRYQNGAWNTWNLVQDNGWKIREVPLHWNACAGGFEEANYQPSTRVTNNNHTFDYAQSNFTSGAVVNYVDKGVTKQAYIFGGVEHSRFTNTTGNYSIKLFAFLPGTTGAVVKYLGYTGFSSADAPQTTFGGFTADTDGNIYVAAGKNSGTYLNVGIAKITHETIQTKILSPERQYSHLGDWNWGARTNFNPTGKGDDWNFFKEGCGTRGGYDSGRNCANPISSSTITNTLSVNVGKNVDGFSGFSIAPNGHFTLGIKHSDGFSNEGTAGAVIEVDKNGNLVSEVSAFNPGATFNVGSNSYYNPEHTDIEGVLGGPEPDPDPNPTPAPRINKTLTVPQPADPNKIDYDIQVSYPEANGRRLKITDELHYPEGVEIESVTWEGGAFVDQPADGGYIGGQRNHYRFEISGMDGGPKTYTIHVKIRPITQAQPNLACSPVGGGHGAYNSATVSVLNENGNQATSSICKDLVPPGPAKTPLIFKTINGITDYRHPSTDRSLDRKRLTYTIYIDNRGANTKEWNLKVKDILGVYKGIQVTSVWVSDPQYGTADELPLTSQGWTYEPGAEFNIADRNSLSWNVSRDRLEAKQVNVYFKNLTYKPNQDNESFRCNPTTPKGFQLNRGASNRVEASPADNPGQFTISDQVCESFIPPSKFPTIQKAFVQFAKDGNSDVAVYDVTIDNTGGATKERKLSVFDFPKFSPNVDIDRVAIQDFAEGQNAPSGASYDAFKVGSYNEDGNAGSYMLTGSDFNGWTVGANKVAKKRIYVYFTRKATPVDSSSDTCQADQPGHGAFNKVDIYRGADYPRVSSQACANIPPAPAVPVKFPSINKEFVEFKKVGGRDVAVYDVTIDNSGNNTVRRSLDVYDFPKFSENVEVEEVKAQDYNADQTTLNESLCQGLQLGTCKGKSSGLLIRADNPDGNAGSYKIVDPRDIKWVVEKNEVSKKQVSVFFTYKAQPVDPSTFACQPGQAGHGAYNKIDIYREGGQRVSSEACETIPSTPPNGGTPPVDNGLTKTFVSSERQNGELIVKYDIDIDSSIYQGGKVYDYPQFAFDWTKFFKKASVEQKIIDGGNEYPAGVGQYDLEPAAISDVRLDLGDATISPTPPKSVRYKLTMVFKDPGHVDGTVTCEGEGTGLYNKAGYFVNGNEIFNNACGDYPQGEEPKTMKVKLAKTDTDGNMIPLNRGWDFTLYPADKNGAIQGNKPIPFVVDVDNKRITETPLLAGDYFLIETRSPEGYELLAQPVKVKLSLGTDNELHVSLPDAANDPAARVDGDVITVADVRAGDMPQAGGKGVFWMLLMGMALIAGAWFFNRRYQH